MQRRLATWISILVLGTAAGACTSDSTDGEETNGGWTVGPDEDAYDPDPDDPDPDDPDPDNPDVYDPPPRDTRACPGVAVCPFHRLDLNIRKPNGDAATEFSGTISVTTVFDDGMGGGGGGGQVLEVDCPSDGPTGMIQCNPPGGPDGVRIRMELVGEDSRVSSVRVDLSSPSGSAKTDVAVKPYEETVEPAPGCPQTCTGTRGGVELRPDTAWSEAGLTQTCGPADGRAYRLVFGTSGSACNVTSNRRVRIYIWDDLPTQENPERVLNLEQDFGGDGRATYCDSQGCREATRGRIEFTNFARGEAASGTWSIVLPDGSKTGSKFDAAWCGSDNCP